MDSPFLLLSPLDGRYAEATFPLRDFFSEFAYHRDRVRVELDLLAGLSKIGLIRPLSESESALLESLWKNLTLADAESIRAFEKQTRHDVKAIEYFLREKLGDASLNDLLSWLHFGLTSEDVNNIAQALSLRDSRDSVLLPVLDDLLAHVLGFVQKHRALPMLARTHGQPAVPTTLGREFAVFLSRLKKSRDEISAHQFESKLTGAVGNFNALQAAFPQTDWLAFSKNFIQAYDLQPNLVTTQILPYDNWLRYFDSVRMFNTILIDFSQDIWRYISDDYLKQAVVEGEVGSSTMPQKVNPIDFENAEGNLGIANALFTHYAQKLSVSRLQRDLSDSTVRRTFGVALGHTLLAWTNFMRGMKRITANEEKIRAELNAHWEVVSEGAQTILRAAGRSDAYETLKAQTRGRILTETDYQSWLENLNVDDQTRAKLKSLTPETYLGLALELCDMVIGQFSNQRFK
ncbi:adenylosuccinate lyase [Anaerolineales bacterium]|nr:adenylosuccinate lyase [Anaerolineales bacterium]